MIGRRVLFEISKRTGTEFSASSVRFTGFKELEIKDLYIQDQNNDTLLYAIKALAVMDSLNRHSRYVGLQRLVLTSPIINIAQDKNSTFNFMFIIDSLSNPYKPDSLRWNINFKKVLVDEGNMSLALAHKAPIVFNDLNVATQIGQQHILVEKFQFGLDNGFTVKRTYADIHIDPQGISIPKLSITSPHSTLILRDVTVQSLDSLLAKTTLDEIDFNLQSNNSFISGRDISCFFPASYAFDNSIIIDGKVNGNLKKLTGRDFHLMVDSIIDFSSDFELQHLQDPQEMSFNIDVHKMEFGIVELAAFYNQMMPDKTFDISPYTHWKEVAYEGSISGIRNNFKTIGNIKTPYGTLATDVFVVLYDSLNTYEYNGDISTRHFHLGQALRDEELIGDASAQLFVTGGKQPDGKFANYFKGEVSALTFKGYNYSGITLEGGLGRRYFNGNLTVDDANAKFDFKGEVDFLSQTPTFNFTLDMAHLAMSQLNLTESYEQLDLSFRLDSRLEGNNVDDMNGFLDIYHTSVQTEYATFKSDSIKFGFKPLDAMPSITLASEYVNGLILGTYNFTELLGYLNGSLKKHLKYLPQFFSTPTNVTPNNFTFVFEIEDMQKMATTLDLPLRSNGASVVSGDINSIKNTFNLESEIPYLKTKKQVIDSITIALHNDDKRFESALDVKRFIFGGDHVMDNIRLRYDIAQDTMVFSTDWDNNASPVYSGDFKANMWLEPYGRSFKTIIETYPSKFVISDRAWHLNKNQVMIQPQRVSIDSLLLNNSESYFMLNGIASSRLSDTMQFEMEEFDLGVLDQFLSINNFTFDGIVSGNAELYSLLHAPVFVSDIRVDSMIVNASSWGNLTAVSEWDRKANALRLYVDSESTEDAENIMSINGAYYPNKDSLDVDADINGFDIQFLQPFLQRTMSHLQGVASGHLDVAGSISNPELYGALMVDGGGFTIDYLSTDFSVNDSIKFDKERFIFDGTQVQDQEGNSGVVTGDVRHTRYKDMLVDIIIESDKFLGLNTTAIENEYFFGDIYFGGGITIKSTQTTTLIGSNARTMQGSILTIPLSPVSTATTNNFINYVEKEEKTTTSTNGRSIEMENLPAKDLIINMDFDVTSAATMRLEFDAQSGDVIEATGNGTLNIQFQRGQPFQMFGEYRIERGDYLFTLQQIFNKKFNVQSGSTLQWSGKPGDAIMNIAAQYPTRASLYNLMPDAIGESNKNRRVPVNVKMFLTNRLSQPNITFDIELPNTDEETKQSVSSIINTEEEMSRQVLSLLIVNSFYTPDYYTDNTGGSQANNQLSNVAAVTASEFLSNQLSNWMSQISDNVDLGFRYIPEQSLTGEGLTPEEYEMAISTQFFNDRLTVNGNVGYQDYAAEARPPNVNSNFVGEVDVELKLNENLKLKAYSHQNDDILYENTSMKQGAGITYQEEFTTVKELSGRYKERISSLFNRKDHKNSEATRKEEEDQLEEENDDGDSNNAASQTFTDSIDVGQ